MTKRHLLVISFRFPPQNPGGVIRAVKFIKYLAKNGIHVHVIVPRGSTNEGYEQDLQSENISIYEAKCPQPFQWVLRKLAFFRPVKRNKADANSKPRPETNSPGPRKKKPIWIRLLWLLRFPDESIFWGRYLRACAQEVLKRYPEIQSAYIHGPPFSHFEAALEMCRSFNVKAVFDFRDPWLLDEGFYYPFSWNRSLVCKMEKRIFRDAHSFIFISETMRRRYASFYQNVREKTYVVQNGFDEEDFEAVSLVLPKKFQVSYSGGLADRDLTLIAKGFEEFLRRDPVRKPECEFVVYGPTPEVMDPVVTYQGSVPHHRWVERCQDCALFVSILQPIAHADEAIPGKIFEYAAMLRPQIFLGPQGEASRLILSSKWGVAFDYSANTAQIADAFENYYFQWKKGRLIPHHSKDSLNEHRRQRLARKLEEILFS